VTHTTSDEISKHTLLFAPFFILLLASFSALPVLASTINFDDLDASSGDIVLDSLNPYHGFDWTNFSVYTSTPGFPGFNNGIVSSPNAAYTGGQILSTTVLPVMGTVTASTAFDFLSADIGAGYYNDLDVTVKGLLNGTTLFTKTVTVNTQGAQLFDFGFSGINALELFASQTASTTDPFNCGVFNCTQFTMDNMVFSPATRPPPPTVPEPSTGSILCIGAVALLAALRWRKVAA
jgi:hypothetical protein